MKLMKRNFTTMLCRFRTASFLNILGLSVAFAAFLVIMMQVDYERSFDRCHPTADRICRVERVTEADSPYNTVIPRAFANAVFNSSPHVKAFTLISLSFQKNYLTVNEGNDRRGFREYLSTCYPGIVDVFDFPIVEGNKDCLKDPEKVLIPQSMARRFFGNHPAVGQQLHMEDKIWLKGDLQTFTVGGVYLDFPKNTQLDNRIYMAMGKHQENDWMSQNFIGYLLLDDANSRKVVEENFNHVFDFASHGELPKNSRMDLTPLTDIYYMPNQVDDIAKSGNKDTVIFLILIALLVILIAAINFTNFSTSLAPIRIKSINTQKVLGSSVLELRWGLVGEAVGISLLSCLLSFVIVWVLDNAEILSFVTANTHLFSHLPLLGLLLGIAGVVGLLAGLYPALYMTSFSPALVLKGSFGLSVSGRKLRTGLIGVQYIVSISLIVGAFIIQLQNNFMRSFDLGFEKDQIAIVEMNPQLYKQSKDTYTNKLKEYPGIEEVAFAEGVLGGSDSYSMYGLTYNDEEFFTFILPVSWNFLRVMGIQVVEGRDFMESDALADSTNTFIYGRTIKERLKMEAGHYLADNWEGKNYIAGIVEDIQAVSLRTNNSNHISLKVTKRKSLPVSYIRLKAGTDITKAVTHIRKTLSDIDPAYPFEIQFYDSVFDQLYHREEYMKKMITLFSLLAIILSIVGVFGLVIFETQYRRKEIGIRKVHGASVGEILLMFNKIYLRIVLVCFLIAAPLAFYGVHKWLENFAQRTPIYWWIFALAFLIVTTVTLITVTFQNWRAANENPVNSIKSE